MHHAWERNTHEVFVGNLEGKGPFWRTKCRWNRYIKIEPENVDWIQLAKVRDQPYAIVNFHVS